MHQEPDVCWVSELSIFSFYAVMHRISLSPYWLLCIRWSCLCGSFQHCVCCGLHNWQRSRVAFMDDLARSWLLHPLLFSVSLWFKHIYVITRKKDNEQKMCAISCPVQCPFISLRTWHSCEIVYICRALLRELWWCLVHCQRPACACLSVFPHKKWIIVPQTV